MCGYSSATLFADSVGLCWQILLPMAGKHILLGTDDQPPLPLWCHVHIMESETTPTYAQYCVRGIFTG